MPVRDVAGLQAERTVLAWDRTTLGVVANGVLVLVHHSAHPERIVVAAMALLVAGLCILSRRRRSTEVRPLRTGQRYVRPATQQVLLIGTGVAVLGGVVIAMIVLDSFGSR
ncbi:MAG: DUF202 domain-containing protein [Sciscionella sp.]